MNKLLFVLLVVVFLTQCRSGENKQGAQSRQAVSTDSIHSLWYKTAIFYTLDVEVFQDSDGDGIGDFRGLTKRLSYIDSLGVDAIWLAPFQPTPNKDDGYDVSDYYDVDPRLGTMTDFQGFLTAASEKGLRVIMDLVVNHTSKEHKWFQEARKSNRSPYRSWYIWSKEKPSNFDKGMVFPGVQESIWTYDSTAGEYYYHRFYEHQPDLNAQNPQVQQEIRKIITHWIRLGLSGFRLDGVPFFIEVPQTKGEKFEHEFQLLRQMRQHVTDLKKEAVILGEANVLPEENKDYFGENGSGMHLMFNFFVNQHLFYSLASGKAGLLQEALKATRDIPATSQWGQFLRNHDELDLGRLSNKERQRVYEEFGPDTNMQLYDRGIRRRLAPMLKDRRRIELAYSLLLSLPSTPVLRYGDEIGMGDDLALKERESVRTPIQWDETKNGGFSSASTTIHPVIDDIVYGYQEVNVRRQLIDSNSLLNWKKKMIHLRKSCPEVGVGEWEIVESGAESLHAVQYRVKNKELLLVHNLAPTETSFEQRMDDDSTGYTDLLTGQAVDLSNGRLEIKLPPYGYLWLRKVKQ